MNEVAESTRTTVGVPRGSPAEDARVALVPSVVPQLVKSGLDVIVERGAGESARVPRRRLRAARRAPRDAS